MPVSFQVVYKFIKNIIGSKTKIYFLPTTSTSALGPNQPNIQWVPGFFPARKAAGVTHLHLVNRLRMSGAIYLPPYMPSLR
jgi:hypothetical protein